MFPYACHCSDLLRQPRNMYMTLHSWAPAAWFKLVLYLFGWQLKYERKVSVQLEHVQVRCWCYAIYSSTKIPLNGTEPPFKHTWVGCGRQAWTCHPPSWIIMSTQVMSVKLDLSINVMHSVAIWRHDQQCICSCVCLHLCERERKICDFS